MSATDSVGPIVCAWCDRQIKQGSPQSPVSHGICLDCMSGVGDIPLEDLSSLSPQALNRLPFGAVKLSGEGIVQIYNQSESRLSGLEPSEVIGKHFFHDIAPCAAVREFSGKLAEQRAAGVNGHGHLRFLFKFARGAKLVEIAMLYNSTSDTFTLLIRPVLSEPRR